MAVKLRAPIASGDEISMSQFDASSGHLGPSRDPQLELQSDGDEPQAPQSRYLDSFGINAGFVEEVEAQFRIDEGSVDPSWSEEFGGGIASAGGARASQARGPAHAR